jgi:DNA invertase Pin-like site-specific DNA recombinase
MQIAVMRERARQEGATIAAIYDEGAKSGRKKQEERPALSEAIAHCKKLGGTLAFYSLSRLARSASEAHRIKDQLISAHCNLVSMKEPGLDSRTPSGKMLFAMTAIFAELEADAISERTSDVLQAKKARGERVGKLPYGKRLAHDGHHTTDDRDHARTCPGCKNLEDVPEEISAMREISQLRTTLSYSRIAAELNARGVRPKNAEKWTRHTTRIAHAAYVHEGFM